MACRQLGLGAPGPRRYMPQPRLSRRGGCNDVCPPASNAEGYGSDAYWCCLSALPPRAGQGSCCRQGNVPPFISCFPPDLQAPRTGQRFRKHGSPRRVAVGYSATYNKARMEVNLKSPHWIFSKNKIPQSRQCIYIDIVLKSDSIDMSRATSRIHLANHF